MGDTVGGYSFFKEGYPLTDGLLNEPRLIDNGTVTDHLFLNENVRILEMNSKSGLYPLYIAYSIYRILLPKAEKDMSLEEAQAIWDEVLRNHLFVLCQTTMAVSITKRTLTGYRAVETNTIYIPRLLERMQDKERLGRKICNPFTWGKEGERLKFDAIVGNPPYQVMDGGNNASAVPIYQEFVQQAIATKPSYISMIMPSRWYAGGRGLDKFRESMMNDTHLRKLYDFSDSKSIFALADISGGICYFLYDFNYDGPCEMVNIDGDTINRQERYLNEFPIIVRANKAISILNSMLASGFYLV